ncbi:hypothetical protein [Streptomyces sp. NPDC001635]
MTTTTAAATPEVRAAALFVGAFNSVFEDCSQMRISLHRSNGSSLTVAGELIEYIEWFDAAEVSTFLGWLTKAVAYDPKAVLAVTSWHWGPNADPAGYAWTIGDGAALDKDAALKVFGGAVELRGAEYSYMTLAWDDAHAQSIVDGLEDAVALDEETRAAIAAHAAPEKPRKGSTYALRAPGTLTWHVVAQDEEAARAALEEIDLEDFDVDFRTRDGHTLGHVTIEGADEAELVSVDGTPADEIDG